MYIYISFFQITRHIIYGTLRILAFPFFKYSSWFNLWRSKYRHFSPPSTHSLLEAEPHTHTSAHTHTHTAQSDWTNCMATTGCCRLEILKSIITLSHSFSEQDGVANMTATEKVQRPNCCVWFCLKIQRTDTKKKI